MWRSATSTCPLPFRSPGSEHDGVGVRVGLGMGVGVGLGVGVGVGVRVGVVVGGGVALAVGPLTTRAEFGSASKPLSSTASKLWPVTPPRVCRASSSQPGSGAPEINQLAPLSATNMP